MKSRKPRNGANIGHIQFDLFRSLWAPRCTNCIGLQACTELPFAYICNLKSDAMQKLTLKQIMGLALLTLREAPREQDTLFGSMYRF